MLSTGSPNRDNPFVADDLLIKAGGFVSALALLSLVLVDGELRSVAPTAGVVTVLGFGLSTLAVGIRLRRRERKAVRLLSLLERFPEISVAQLLDGSRLQRQDVERAVATVNERGLHYVVWDRERDTLVDGRLVAGSVVVDDCPECGANIGLSVSLANPAAACCPYCRSGVPAAALDALRQRRLAALDAERAHERELRSRERLPAAASADGRTFSVGLFVVLTVLAPPLGVGYAIYGGWRAMRRRGP